MKNASATGVLLERIVALLKERRPAKPEELTALRLRLAERLARPSAERNPQKPSSTRNS